MEQMRLHGTEETEEARHGYNVELARRLMRDHPEKVEAVLAAAIAAARMADKWLASDAKDCGNMTFEGERAHRYYVEDQARRVMRALVNLGQEVKP